MSKKTPFKAGDLVHVTYPPELNGSQGKVTKAEQVRYGKHQYYVDIKGQIVILPENYVFEPDLIEQLED